MQKTFQHNNAVINYSINGEGTPVVLLHGFGADATIWSNQAAFLQNQCRLIIPHFPGSGLSTFTDNENAASAAEDTPSTLEYYTDCVHALLQQENIESCIMLGHSMGGYITLNFAEQYPQFLKGFGLIHSSAFADTDEKKLHRKRSIDLMESYGVYSFLKNTTPILFSEKFRKEQPEKIMELVEQGNIFTVKALQQYYTAMMNRPDRTHVLQNSEVPVLFVIGTEDVAAPISDVLQQVHLPKIAYIHILEGTGHMGMWEAPDELNNFMLEFIKGII
ncbi:MAG: alpha/beta hydrolase [Panacibacter sp.]